MNTDLMFSSKSDEWETPLDLFNELDREFNFTLDPCATDENHKVKKYYTKKDNGLIKSWAGEVVFVNPPYGRSIGKWVEKSYYEAQNATVVMLIPARTDTSYFHDYIYHNAEIRFLRGRIKFINRALPSWREDGNFKISGAPFPSMIVVFKNRGK